MYLFLKQYLWNYVSLFCNTYGTRWTSVFSNYFFSNTRGTMYRSLAIPMERGGHRFSVIISLAIPVEPCIVLWQYLWNVVDIGLNFSKNENFKLESYSKANTPNYNDTTDRHCLLNDYA